MKRFTGYHLKLIALLTMLVDHVAAVVIWRIYMASFDITASMQLSNAIGDQIVVWVASNQEIVAGIYELMRYVGRMAFPIYCFLLVEGFLHTSNVKKYALRLLAFAFVSEIPFDLAFTGFWWDASSSNVFFTLVLGLLLIWGISYVEKFYEFWQEKKWEPILGLIITAGAGLVLTGTIGLFADIVLGSDYGLSGIVAILILYLFRKYRDLGFALSILALTVMSSSIEIVALFMLYPLMKYDGTRGKNIKYVFYAFYPVHLLVLALICMGLGV